MNTNIDVIAIENPAPPTTQGCVVLGLDTRQGTTGPGPQRILLMDALGTWPAITWLRDLAAHDVGSVLKIDATLVARGGPEGEDALVAATLRPDLDILPLLPDSLCPIAGVVTATARLLQSIRSPALRRFMSDVFSRCDVHRAYWTAPASDGYHHAYPGGLASHGLEMASRVPLNFPPPERDLALVHSVVHDIGKVLTYRANGGLTPKARVLGHELLSLDVLWQPLKSLEAQWPDTAYLLRALVAGLWKLRCYRSKEMLAVVEIVTALDHWSTERDRRRQARGGSTPWAPREWADPCYDEDDDEPSIEASRVARAEEDDEDDSDRYDLAFDAPRN